MRGIQPEHTQTTLLSFRDYLEYCNFACINFRYDGFYKANNKGTDQTVRMHRLICAFVVCKHFFTPQTGFLASKPICDEYHQEHITASQFMKMDEHAEWKTVRISIIKFLQKPADLGQSCFPKRYIHTQQTRIFFMNFF